MTAITANIDNLLDGTLTDDLVEDLTAAATSKSELSVTKDDLVEDLTAAATSKSELGVTNVDAIPVTEADSRDGEIVPISNIAVLPVSNKGFTGNTYIDGILWGGNYWNSSSSPTVIDYSFWNSGTASFDDPYDNYATNPYDWFSGERASMVNALNTWSAVANIQFVDVGDDVANATLGFYNINDADAGGFLGLFNPPGTSGEGIGYFNWQGTGWNTSGNTLGDYGFITLIHELGHGLGLAHPHDNGGGSSIYPGVTSAFGDTGDYGLNQGVYTTMSYNDGLVASGGDPGTYAYGYQGTPMAFDIAAIQYLYGANNSYQTGNNTYFLPTANQIGTGYSCIWDTGGTDKISGQGALSGTTINLNDATLNAAVDGAGAGGYISSASGIYGGFTIANSVKIENADGSNFNDLITGNEFNNILDGKSGNDSLFGGAGIDTLKGNTGNDFVDGGSGNDDVTGGDNNDVLVGGSGNDKLTGALANDRFLYDTGRAFVKADVGRDTIADLDRKAGSGDTVFDQIVLDKTTFTSLASIAGVGFSVAGEFKIVTSDNAAKTSSGEIVYNKTNDKLFYNQNGAGAGFGTGDLFATLTGITSLAAADFLIQA